MNRRLHRQWLRALAVPDLDRERALQKRIMKVNVFVHLCRVDMFFIIIFFFFLFLFFIFFCVGGAQFSDLWRWCFKKGIVLRLPVSFYICALVVHMIFFFFFLTSNFPSTLASGGNSRMEGFCEMMVYPRHDKVSGSACRTGLD